jgi:tetratricopeptide (TPR) repeat protein
LSSILDTLLNSLHRSPLLITLAAAIFLRMHQVAKHLSIQHILEQLCATQQGILHPEPLSPPSATSDTATLSSNHFSITAVENSCALLVAYLFQHKLFLQADCEENTVTALQQAADLAAIMSVMPESGAPSVLFEPKTTDDIEDESDIDADNLHNGTEVSKQKISETQEHRQGIADENELDLDFPFPAITVANVEKEWYGKQTEPEAEKRVGDILVTAKQLYDVEDVLAKTEQGDDVEATEVEEIGIEVKATDNHDLNYEIDATAPEEPREHVTDNLGTSEDEAPIQGDGFVLFMDTAANREAVLILASCGLLQRSFDERRFLMHAVVQSAIRVLTFYRRFQSTAADVGSALWKVIRSDINEEKAEEPDSWVRCRLLLPIAVQLCEHQILLSQSQILQLNTDQLLFLCQFLLDTSIFIEHIQVIKLFSCANRFFRRALEIADRLGSKRLTLKCLQNLAGLLYDIGEYHYAEAEQLTLRALKIAEDLHAAELGRHPDVVDCLEVLAMLLEHKDSQYYAESEATFRRILEIEEYLHSKTGDRLNELSSAMYNLAGFIDDNKGAEHAAESEILHRRGLEILEFLHVKLQGKHPDIALSLKNLAICLVNKGAQHFAEAEQLLRRALHILESVYADVKGQHSTVAKVLYHLANLVGARGPQHYGEAEALHRRALSIHEEEYSSSQGQHADVSRSLNSVALLVEEKGPLHYDEAEKLYRRSLEIDEYIYSHVQVAYCS